MPNLGYADLPVPSGLDIPDVPADLTRLVESLDPHLVQHVANITERDTRLRGAPAGTVAVSTGNGATWARVGSTWVTIWEPPPAWRATTLSANMVAPSPVQVRRIGKLVWMRGQVARKDAQTFPVNGNNEFVGEVPYDCRPSRSTHLPIATSLAGAAETGAARVQIGQIDAAGSGAGDIMIYSQVKMGWASLLCSWWLD